jgi:hypothetical protein
MSEVAFGTTRRGLKIRPRWLAALLSGQKKIEIRSMFCKIREEISLVEVGSGLVKGRARLTDCRRLTQQEEIEYAEALSSLKYQQPWAWVLEDVRRVDEPVRIPMEVRKFSVIWVRKERWEALERKL